MAPARTTNSSPRYSVVIPTFRRAELLVQALQSVTAQTFTDLEIVVVDDDPHASARDAVTDFSRENPSVAITYSLNDHARGGAGTRNAGLAQASGDWVAFLDDDDTWLPEKLQRVEDLVRSRNDPDLVLVYSANVKYDFDTQRVLDATQPRARGWVLDKVLYGNCVGGMSVVVARRETLTEIGGFDERFPSLQDMELYVRMAERGTFDFVAEPLVRIRYSARERITFDPRKKLQGAQLFSRKYADLLGRSARLKHRAASRTFVFALAANDYLEAAKRIPWTLAGLMVDPSNLRYVFNSMGRQLKARGIGTMKTLRASTR